MRKIILSKRASAKLEKLIEYLENEWSDKVKFDFIKKLEKQFKNLLSYPESNEKSELRKGLYRCVITKQTVIFYLFNANSVKIVFMHDSRMDPRKIKP
jgi:plasmid stabilization system protein ParE